MEPKYYADGEDAYAMKRDLTQMADEVRVQPGQGSNSNSRGDSVLGKGGYFRTVRWTEAVVTRGKTKMVSPCHCRARSQSPSFPHFLSCQVGTWPLLTLEEAMRCFLGKKPGGGWNRRDSRKIFFYRGNGTTRVRGSLLKSRTKLG